MWRNASAPRRNSNSERTAQDIRGGTLKEMDVLVQPGGSGSKQAAALGTEGCDAIKTFVNDGGGYVGICGGALPGHDAISLVLHILNARVVDREHWARGKGVVQIRWTDAGKQLLGKQEPISSVDYGQGPLFAGYQGRTRAVSGTGDIRNRNRREGGPAGRDERNNRDRIGYIRQGPGALHQPAPRAQ